MIDSLLLGVRYGLLALGTVGSFGIGFAIILPAIIFVNVVIAKLCAPGGAKDE